MVPVVKLVFQFENTLLHVDITFDFSSSVAIHSETERESKRLVCIVCVCCMIVD